VGAPVGVPGTDLGLDGDGLGGPCIRGEWEHVRHIRPRLRGNFHASRFDSLQCGCLGCLDESGRDSCTLDTTNPGAGDLTCPEGLVSEDGLCFATVDGANKKENRVCGPEPRKAPANKICFSGVGDYTFSNGKRDRASVVFRVDIIDRSEPGGGFPGGSVDPPDRYRMRIWFLCNPTDPTDCLDPRTEGVALREAVACGDPLTEAISAPLPNIDDGGDLDRGNHQLHPPTGAECTE